MKNVDLDWKLFVAKSEEYVHRKTDVKHISDFARPCNIFISCLNVNGILTMQWWEDDIEFPMWRWMKLKTDLGDRLQDQAS